jgi:hypothetical protein
MQSSCRYGRNGMQLTFCVRLRRGIADFRSGVRARRAVRKMFCGYCERDLFCSTRSGDLYCSDQCADRDWARQSLAICLRVY